MAEFSARQVVAVAAIAGAVVGGVVAGAVAVAASPATAGLPRRRLGRGVDGRSTGRADKKKPPD